MGDVGVSASDWEFHRDIDKPLWAFLLIPFWNQKVVASQRKDEREVEN
jgi:hypothetical protein